HPHVVRVRIEGRNNGLGDGPSSRMSPYQPGSPRTKHPFVRPGDQKIAAYLAQPKIFHAQSVNSVDAQDHLVLFGSRYIEFLNGSSYFGKGKFQASAGMHPGHRHDSSSRAHAFDQRLHQTLSSDFTQVLIQRNATHRGSGALGPEPKGSFRRIMVVG